MPFAGIASFVTPLTTFDYIVTQPHLDAMHWQAEVQKMINVYGARINESDAKVIADYLAKTYGPQEAKKEEKVVGGKR